MKKIFRALLLFLALTSLSFATEDEVYLQTSNIHHFCNPTTTSKMLENANYNSDYSSSNSIDEDFLLEEDFSDNKIERAFSRFINDKMINNKGLKLLSAPIKD